MSTHETRAPRLPDYAENALFRSVEAAAVSDATTTESIPLARQTRDSTSLVGGVAVIALDVAVHGAASCLFEVFASDTEGSGGTLVGTLTTRGTGNFILSADLGAVNAAYPTGPVYLYIEATPSGGAVKFSANLQKIHA